MSDNETQETQETPFTAGQFETIVSEAAWSLIIEFEVGGPSDYHMHPEWPGEQSGVTIGIGYDLGYSTRADILSEWLAYIDPVTLNRLAECAGLKGWLAETKLSDVRDIAILWDAAIAVFAKKSIPQMESDTMKAFPGVDQLPVNASGALCSLVYNRGPLVDHSDRRREMLTIQELVPQKDLAGIARNIRSMKRLWVGTSIERGMDRRRDAEAALMELAMTNQGTPLQS